MRDCAEIVASLREAPEDWYDKDLHYQAADAIVELLAQKQSSDERGEYWQEKYLHEVPHWISVEEALPKKPGRYLCMVRSVIWEEAYYAEVLGFDHGFFHDTGIRDDVTHWMPLPSAPKEDADVE